MIYYEELCYLLNTRKQLDEKYTSIATLSSKEFCDEIKSIVSAKYNDYDSKTELNRLEIIADLLANGIDQKDILEIVNKKIENVCYRMLSH